MIIFKNKSNETKENKTKQKKKNETIFFFKKYFF